MGVWRGAKVQPEAAIARPLPADLRHQDSAVSDRLDLWTIPARASTPLVHHLISKAMAKALLNPFICSSCYAALQLLPRRSLGARSAARFSRRAFGSSPTPVAAPIASSHLTSTRVVSAPAPTSHRVPRRRWLATAAASNSTRAPPPSPAPSTTTAILNPRSDAESGELMHIGIMPRAASRLHQMMAKESNPSLCLRISVESGGCHGFQYLMSLTDTAAVSPEDDTVFVADRAADGNAEWQAASAGKAKVVMDEASLELLKGSNVDYTMELIGSQFKITDNPRATSSCGCGTSFDVKDIG